MQILFNNFHYGFVDPLCFNSLDVRILCFSELHYPAPALCYLPSLLEYGWAVTQPVQSLCEYYKTETLSKDVATTLKKPIREVKVVVVREARRQS